VTRADVVAGILWIGATFYALFGGADFGGGFWDLVAGGAEKGERPRALIQRSLTPVWEANHVWLIFILVVLWTAFPSTFSAIMSTLYVPLALAAIGIVLRGSGFAFRKSIEGLEARRAAGATFALSSVLTPFFMGTVVGAIAAGNVPPEGNGDAFSTWLQPLPLLIGAMFVATGAYLAAVFLVGDARRAGEEKLERYFVRRALAAAAVAGIAAAFGLVELHAEARYVFDRLMDEGLPLVVLSGLCGIALLALLLGRRSGGFLSLSERKPPRAADLALRPLAAGAVVAVIWGWGVAQFPYLLPTSLKITQSAAPPDTLGIVIVVFIVAAVLVLPSLGLLYWLSQRDLLESEH
jgi:cytochrome bd ubiquinol oxidase subunit II